MEKWPAGDAEAGGIISSGPSRTVSGGEIDNGKPRTPRVGVQVRNTGRTSEPSARTASG